MGKSPKDSADWRSSSEALFRAARGDNLDADAADFARVEAQLARRLAAGAPALDGDGQGSVAKLARHWAPGLSAKLWIGVTLLAAGSLALVLTKNSAPARVAPPTDSVLTPSASAAPASDRHDRAPTPVPEESASSPVRELSSAPRVRERTRHEVPARVAPAHSSIRDTAPSSRSAHAAPDSKPVPLPSAPTPASADTDSRTAQVSAQPAPSRGMSTKQPDPRPQPSTASTLETQPAAAEAAARTETRRIPVRDASADARAELALVERMHAAMRAAKPAEALELCAEHAERWPNGVFTEEREAVSAIASCVLRSDDAAARARLFLSKHPRAPTAPRVAAACAPLSAAKNPGASSH